MPTRLFAPLSAIVVALQLLVVTASPVRAEDSVPGTPDVTITLRNGLSDRDVSVPRGGVVRFVNRDDERHRIRSRSGEGFDTGNLEPGESFQVRLATAGMYAYIDEREDDDARYFGRIRVAGGAAGSAGGGAAGPTGGTNTGGAPAAAATVTIIDEAFDPGTTTVEVGATVTFENLDGDEHTATSAGAGGIDSGVLASGATYRKRFTEAGRYAFLCIFHPDMRGTIEVVGSGNATAPDPAPATPTATPAPAPDGPLTGPATDAAVDIVDLAFEPADIEVATGGTVTWTNTGVAPHTATAEDRSFDSTTLDSGATFSQTFSTPGTFAYLCQIHPDMRGTVRVVDAGGAAAAASPPGQAAAVAPPDQPATTSPPTNDAAADTSPAATIESPLTPGSIAAVVLVSVAVVLFAKVLAGTPRRAEER